MLLLMEMVGVREGVAEKFLRGLLVASCEVWSLQIGTYKDGDGVMEGSMVEFLARCEQLQFMM